MMKRAVLKFTIAILFLVVFNVVPEAESLTTVEDGGKRFLVTDETWAYSEIQTACEEVSADIGLIDTNQEFIDLSAKLKDALKSRTSNIWVYTKRIGTDYFWTQEVVNSTLWAQDFFVDVAWFISTGSATAYASYLATAMEPSQFRAPEVLPYYLKRVFKTAKFPVLCMQEIVSSDQPTTLMPSLPPHSTATTIVTTPTSTEMTSYLTNHGDEEDEYEMSETISTARVFDTTTSSIDMLLPLSTLTTSSATKTAAATTLVMSGRATADILPTTAATASHVPSTVTTSLPPQTTATSIRTTPTPTEAITYSTTTGDEDDGYDVSAFVNFSTAFDLTTVSIATPLASSPPSPTATKTTGTAASTTTPTTTPTTTTTMTPGISTTIMSLSATATSMANKETAQYSTSANALILELITAESVLSSGTTNDFLNSSTGPDLDLDSRSPILISPSGILALCNCRCPPGVNDSATRKMFKDRPAEIQRELYVEKANVSAAVRKRTSAQDMRAESFYTGTLIVACFGSVFGLFIYLDVKCAICYVWRRLVRFLYQERKK